MNIGKGQATPGVTACGVETMWNSSANRPANNCYCYETKPDYKNFFYVYEKQFSSDFFLSGSQEADLPNSTRG